jgi:hypothetical protein
MSRADSNPRTRLTGRDEMTCDCCGRRHGVVWFAPSDIWNAVMRGGDRANPDEFPFCCPECFIHLAEQRGVKAKGWLVTPEDLLSRLEEAEAREAALRDACDDLRRLLGQAEAA